MGEMMEASNIKPVTILGSYLCLAAVLTAQILRLLYQAKVRPQTQQQDPRYRTPKSAHLVLFATLAVVSLVITWYYMLAFFKLSYQTWARNNNVPLPVRLWRSDVLLARNEDVGGLHLGPWLRETKLFKDAWETVIDGKARFWWSQQIFLITTIWSVFLGVEGNRRKIPHLWIFMLLGQIVAISFAMNLSFLAMLLYNPAPVDKRRVQYEQGQGNQTRTLYVLSTYTLYFALGAVFGSIFHIPSFVGTSKFLSLLALPHVLLFLPVIIPQHWSQFDLILGGQPRATSVVTNLYRLTVGPSVVLFVRATYLALRDQEPGEALAIFNALSSHPAVSSVGWDVILCFLSATFWASIDNTSTWRTLKYILPIVRWYPKDPDLKNVDDLRKDE